MARMTISVPDELKAQMDMVEPVNWSKVAQRAFAIEYKCKAVSANMDRDGVIARLRASAQKRLSETRPLYVNAGGDWVRHEAEFNTLSRMSNGKVDDDEIRALMVKSSYLPKDSAILADHIAAWAEGAMAVWDQVKHQI